MALIPEDVLASWLDALEDVDDQIAQAEAAKEAARAAGISPREQRILSRNWVKWRKVRDELIADLPTWGNA